MLTYFVFFFMLQGWLLGIRGKHFILCFPILAPRSLDLDPFDPATWTGLAGHANDQVQCSVEPPGRGPLVARLWPQDCELVLSRSEIHHYPALTFAYLAAQQTKYGSGTACATLYLGTFPRTVPVSRSSCRWSGFLCRRIPLRRCRLCK